MAYGKLGQLSSCHSLHGCTLTLDQVFKVSEALCQVSTTLSRNGPLWLLLLGDLWLPNELLLLGHFVMVPSHFGRRRNARHVYIFCRHATHRAHICIVPIVLAFEAKYRHVLLVVHPILSQNLNLFLLGQWFLLTVSRLMAQLAAIVAPHSCHWLHKWVC